MKSICKNFKKLIRKFFFASVNCGIRDHIGCKRINTYLLGVLSNPQLYKHNMAGRLFYQFLEIYNNIHGHCVEYSENSLFILSFRIPGLLKPVIQVSKTRYFNSFVHFVPFSTIYVIVKYCTCPSVWSCSVKFFLYPLLALYSGRFHQLPQCCSHQYLIVRSVSSKS